MVCRSQTLVTHHFVGEMSFLGIEITNSGMRRDRNTDLRRRSVLILKLEFEPVCQVSEVPDIVLEHQDDLFGGQHARVALASLIQVVHCPTNVLEKEGPTTEGGSIKQFFRGLLFLFNQHKEGTSCQILRAICGRLTELWSILTETRSEQLTE